MTESADECTKETAVFKNIGPKLVPFFKTLVIYFILYGDGSKPDSIIYCAVKCLPVLSLIVFVLLHGSMTQDNCCPYSRKIITGLVFSCVGDALLGWKNSDFFIEALIMFAIAQVMYTAAFGFRPLRPQVAVFLLFVAIAIYAHLYPGLQGAMVYLTMVYIGLIGLMGWRAIARVRFHEDFWNWTRWCCCLGSLCFIVSDFVIAVDKFRYPVPFSHQIIMMTYYAAQFGITVSVVDSPGDSVFAQKGHVKRIHLVTKKRQPLKDQVKSYEKTRCDISKTDSSVKQRK